MARRPVVKKYDDALAHIDANKSLYQSLLSDAAGFDQLTKLVEEKIGIHLLNNPKNVTLLASRFSKVLLELDFSSYVEMVNAVRTHNKEVEQAFINAITTNHTHFMREMLHFVFLREQLKKHSRPTCEIWSAASSMGHELYTVMIEALEARPHLRAGLKLYGTDVDSDAIETAKRGDYGTEIERHLSAETLEKYFTQYEMKGRMRHRVKSDYRALTQFAEQNLLAPRYPFINKFDYVFVRNVLIYFQNDVSQTILTKVHRALKDDGFLIVGVAETGAVPKELFERTDTVGVYKKIVAGGK